MKLYIIIFKHLHGIDVWPRFDTSRPTEGQIVRELCESGEWNEDDNNRSYFEIRGPFEVPAEARRTA